VKRKIIAMMLSVFGVFGFVEAGVAGEDNSSDVYHSEEVSSKDVSDSESSKDSEVGVSGAGSAAAAVAAGAVVSMIPGTGVSAVAVGSGVANASANIYHGNYGSINSRESD